jgi:GAF domain-containing protein
MRSSSSAVAEVWIDGNRYSDFPELLERTCEISVPVVVAGRERGKLLVYSCRAHSFSARELALVMTVARKVGYTV